MPIDLDAVEFAHPVPEQNSMSTFDCARWPRDTSWRQIGIVTVADERFTLFWRHTTIVPDQTPFRPLIKVRQSTRAHHSSRSSRSLRHLPCYA